MVTGATTKRSPDLDADHLTAQLRTVAVAELAESVQDELWLIADGSDLRKPYAKTLPYLMQVRALDKSLVPGYRTLTVLGLTPQRRGVLYHRVFSSTAPDFVSEPAEVQTALQTVSRAIAPLKVSRSITWILDSGFDDVAVWRTIWEQDEHLVVRVAHPERLVDMPDVHGSWQPGSIDAARAGMAVVAQAQTQMEVQKRGQPRAKRQSVQVQIRACPIRVTYATNVRRTGMGQTVMRTAWLLEIQLLDTPLEPWLLITDWEVGTAAQAIRIFQMYRQTLERGGLVSSLPRRAWAGRTYRCWIWTASVCWWHWRGWLPASCIGWGSLCSGRACSCWRGWAAGSRVRIAHRGS